VPSALNHKTSKNIYPENIRSVVQQILMSQTNLTVLLLFICLFWLSLFHFCPVYCPLLFVFVCCAVSVIGHLAVDSAR
jgi:hypothetical protein